MWCCLWCVWWLMMCGCVCDSCFMVCRWNLCLKWWVRCIGKRCVWWCVWMWMWMIVIDCLIDGWVLCCRVNEIILILCRVDGWVLCFWVWVCCKLCLCWMVSVWRIKWVVLCSRGWWRFWNTLCSVTILRDRCFTRIRRWLLCWLWCLLSCIWISGISDCDDDVCVWVELLMVWN